MDQGQLGDGGGDQGGWDGGGAEQGGWDGGGRLRWWRFRRRLRRVLASRSLRDRLG